MKLLVCSLFIGVSLSSYSQVSRPFKIYMIIFKPTAPVTGYFTSELNYRPGGNLNYLYPIYQLFREEKKFKKLFRDNSYYDQLSVAVSFTEDYESALQYQKLSYKEM